MSTRSGLLVLLVAVLAAAPIRAQQAVPPSADSTSEPAPRRSWWQAASRSGTIAVGMARNGPAVRLAHNWTYPLGARVSIGVLGRVVGAHGAYTATNGLDAGGPTDLYVELSNGLRPAWQVTDRVEVAGSIGYGVAFLTPPDDGGFTPFQDAGFVVPLEAEVVARLSRVVGLSVAASRSLGTHSAVCGAVEAVRFDAKCPSGYALDNWTTTVGIRFGR